MRKGVGYAVLAALLYLGSGVGLACCLLARHAIGAGAGAAPLARADLPWLAAIVACGGVLGPVLLLAGLRGTPASSAALLRDPARRILAGRGPDGRRHLAAPERAPRARTRAPGGRPQPRTRTRTRRPSRPPACGARARPAPDHRHRH